MRKLSSAILTFFVAATMAVSCGDDDAGLKCKSGDFYLDGKEFTSCDQCASDDCGFEGDVTEVCTYPNGVQHCEVTSGTVTAHCGGQTATAVISDGVYACR